MRRLLQLWLALLSAYWLTSAVTSSLLLGRVDTGPPALLELVAIPALQAALLGWITRQPGAPRLALPWTAGWALLPLRFLLALDAAALLAAGLASSTAMPVGLANSTAMPVGIDNSTAMPVGLAQATSPAWLGPLHGSLAAWLTAGNLPTWLAAMKLAAAAVLFLVAIARPAWSRRERLTIAPLAAALLALALEPWRAWLADLPALLPPILSPAERWFAAYGALLALGLLLGAGAAAALRRRSLPAGGAADWALAFLLTAALCAVLDHAGAPAGRHPWAAAARLLGSLAATAMVFAAALGEAAVRQLRHPEGRVADPGDPA